VSGAHEWKGTAETLKAKPTTMKKMPTVTSSRLPLAPPNRWLISVRRVVPVAPKTSDMP
jgi:hypothetical protein